MPRHHSAARQPSDRKQSAYRALYCAAPGLLQDGTTSFTCRFCQLQVASCYLSRRNVIVLPDWTVRFADLTVMVRDDEQLDPA